MRIAYDSSRLRDRLAALDEILVATRRVLRRALREAQHHRAACHVRREPFGRWHRGHVVRTKTARGSERGHGEASDGRIESRNLRGFEARPSIHLAWISQPSLD